MSRAKAPYRRRLWGETRFLMDYLQARYPGERWYTEMRVGPTEVPAGFSNLPPSQLKVFRAWNGTADAIVVLRDRLVAIEPGIRKVLEKVGCLLAVMNDIPQTEELGEARFLPVHGEIVVPFHHLRTERVCQQVGLRYVYFPWPHLEEALFSYERNFRTQPLSGVRQTFIE